jgi:RNA polymerase sigma-70 factor, ECF subfamily
MSKTMNSELIERVKQHDPQALAEFIQEQRRPLLVFIERQLGAALRKKLEPEDIAQEVSAEAIRSLPSMDFGDRDPFSWLCQIVERKIIDNHRRFFDAKKRDAAREIGIHGSNSNDNSEQQGGLINMLIASMTTASQAFSRNVKQMRLAEAINQLPEDQREALRLRYIEDLPSKEIAERLGKSDASIRVMLTRSLKKLQDLLNVHDDN